MTSDNDEWMKKIMNRATFDRLWGDVVASVRPKTAAEQRLSIPFSGKKDNLRRKIELTTSSYQLTLTLREAETLLLISYGNTVPETAQLLGLSTRTVELYVVNLRSKFQCKSKRELIERVIADRLLAQLRKGLS